jgi:DNA-binding transcriptional regulator YdaS (Cro superfamily)
MDNQSTHLQTAIDHMGGVSKAATILGLKTYQTLQQWRRMRVPAEYCPRIERATHGAVRCEDLRPDVDWAYLRATDCPVEPIHQEEAA